MGVGDAGSRLGWPLGDILQRVAIRDVRIADGQPAGPATPGFAALRGNDVLTEIRIRRPGLAAGQGVAQRGGEQPRPTAATRQAVVATAFAPQLLAQGEAVGALGGVVDGVGNVDAAVDRDAVQALAAGREQGGNLRVGVGFIPQGARENGRAVLVAGEAEVAVGVEDLRLAAGPVVLDELELETAGRFVVADHFEDGRFFLVAEVEAVFQEEFRIRAIFRVDRNNHSRKGEIVRRCRRPLQRATEWNEDALGGRQGAARVCYQLSIEAGEQGSKGKGEFDCALAVARHGEKLVEQRAADGGQIFAGHGRVNDPGRRRAGRFSRSPHHRSRPAGQTDQAGQQGVAQVHGRLP